VPQKQSSETMVFDEKVSDLNSGLQRSPLEKDNYRRMNSAPDNSMIAPHPKLIRKIHDNILSPDIQHQYQHQHQHQHQQQLQHQNQQLQQHQQHQQKLQMNTEQEEQKDGEEMHHH
jgi:hypothetical protein